MVFGLIGVFIGLALGAVGGIWGGSVLFAKYFEDLDVQRFDIRADYDSKVPVPKSDGKPVPRKYRAFLKYFPNWASMPDFYRVTWMNHVMRTLWPHYNQAIGKMVLEAAKPQIEAVTKQYPFIEAIDIELIDFGTKPTTVAGIKVYDSTDDEVIMEAPLHWGSNARVRASMRLRISKWSFYIPVEISNFQMKVTSRITLRPLVDTLPCMGAVTISLIETPHIDFALHLFTKFDLMLLPGVRDAALYAIHGVIGDMLQYPNKMTFDIMEGGGIAPPPIGMLQIKISKVEKITAGGDFLSKVDPYIELGVRDDRHQRTKTVWNTKNPEFEEVFNLIVDSIDTQTLTIKLHDDDLGFNDPVIGIAEQDLADAEYIKHPKKRVPMTLDFISPPALKKMNRLVKKRQEQERKPQKAPAATTDENGRKVYRIPDAPVVGESKEKKQEAKVATLIAEAMYIPFKGAGKEGVEGEGMDADGATSEAPQGNSAGQQNMAAKITAKDKGILTVTLTGCTNLESSDRDVDPYVEFTLNDPERVKPEVQRSSHMHNEPNPHWNVKFDFAMISATSVLAIHVFDKKTTMQAVMHNPMKAIAGKVTGKPAQADEPIGSLRIKVKDVVRNDRLRDSWALQETQKGDVHLTLDWNPVILDHIEGLAEAGDQKEVERRREEKEEEQRREEGEKESKPTPEKKHHHLPHMPFTHKKEKSPKEKSPKVDYEKPKQKVEYE